jgi:putative endopeptidase
MKKITSSPRLLFVVAVFMYSCNNSSESVQDKKGLSIQNINLRVKPGDNFFLYANGSWLDTAKIPGTESRIGAGLEMYNSTKEHIKSILEEVSKSNNAPGTIEQKVGDFYASGMDTVAIEKAGYSPLKPSLQKINDIKDINGLLQFIAGQAIIGNQMLIGQFVGADEKNSTKNIAAYYQSGLGLPDRDYYFKQDAPTQAVVKAYQTFIKKVFTLLGDDNANAETNMAKVYEVEKQLAKSHRTNVELRNPQTNYNKMAVADLDKKMPLIGWKTLLHNLLVNTDSVNIGQPAYYTALNGLLTTVAMDSWKAYLRFHLVSNFADALSNDFVNANFEFSGKALNGLQQLKERWERIYMQTDGNLGDALGQLYVKKYFTEDAKKRMLDLVNNLQRSFESRISKLDWMSDSTKQKAKEKLLSFIKKIGYTDKWRDYSKVSISKNSYFENHIACSQNEYNYQVGKVGNPVDRSEWGMTPSTINAYYNPTFNEIVFPAGILQFPMFDANVDDAMNYGCIGMVIGHEMTHGFDDQGAQYDKDGNLKNWWSKEDFAKFKAKGQQVINLYNSFRVLDSQPVNGSLTQGENTADIGGIAIAYDAFKMTKQGSDTTRIDGFRPDQRFFLSFAQCWRKKVKDEALRQQINTDPHSPAMYRVWGPLMNFDPFYTAFNVKEGDKMFVPQKDRIHIW